MIRIKKLLDVQSHKKLYSYTDGYKKTMLFITLISAIATLSNVVIAFLCKEMIDSSVSGEKGLALMYGLIFSFVMLFELVLTSFKTNYIQKKAESAKNAIQIDLIGQIYQKKWLVLNRYPTGDLQTRLYDDINNVVNALIITIPQLIAFGLQLIAAFTFICYYDVRLAVLTSLITPITILISVFIGRKLKSIQHGIQSADGVKRSLINESLQNILILKAFGFLNPNVSLIRQAQQSHFSLILKKYRLSIQSNLMIGLGYRLGFLSALVIGAIRLGKKEITFGIFTAFLQLVAQIQAPIQGLATSLPQLIASLSSVERIDELRELESEFTTENSHGISSALPTHIELSGVSFGYVENRTILKDVNLVINQGQKVAIVGPSGEGKTTLIHILLGMIEADKGMLHIALSNEQSIDIGVDTRRYFSYVPQSQTLFSGSIKSNFLLLHDVDGMAIEKALVTSCSKTFIDDLPDGLETLLGERGIGLSQGQAQRLTIARALLHDTPFLVFDEATSALDLETEKQLIDNLKLYYPEKTLIAVTHRESIFDICDKVYTLKGGVLVEAL